MTDEVATLSVPKKKIEDGKIEVGTKNGCIK
jgi:hypothetical protein